MMTHTEIVIKLIGPIRPVGDASVDPERLENLKDLTDLVNALVVLIDDVATINNDSHEHSRAVAGKHAYKFLAETLGISE